RAHRVSRLEMGLLHHGHRPRNLRWQARRPASRSSLVMTQRTLNVGLIGYRFMGRAHSHALRALPVFAHDLPVRTRMRTICGRDPEALREVAERYGWERTETSWEAVVADPEIDIIDIVTPGRLH